MIYPMKFRIISRVVTIPTSLVPPRGVDGMEITAKRGARSRASPFLPPGKNFLSFSLLS